MTCWFVLGPDFSERFPVLIVRRYSPRVFLPLWIPAVPATGRISMRRRPGQLYRWRSCRRCNSTVRTDSHFCRLQRQSDTGNRRELGLGFVYSPRWADGTRCIDGSLAHQSEEPDFHLRCQWHHEQLLCDQFPERPDGNPFFCQFVTRDLAVALLSL